MATTNNLNPSVELRGPAGQFLGAAVGSMWPNAEITVTVTNGGTFTIICKDMNNQTGSYGVSMVRLSGYPLSAGDPDLGPIANGQVLAGTIALPGDLDAATFTASAGDTVQIRMATTNNLNPSVELRGPAGQFLGAAVGSMWPNAEITVTVTNGGTFTIICKDMNNQTGSYGVSMVRLSGYPLSAGDPDLGPIANGQVLAGTIALPGDLDAATFTASAGDTVQIRMATTNNLNPSVELRGPAGQFLGAAVGSMWPNAEITVTVTNGGTFTIICKDMNNQTGGYTVAMVRLPGSPPAAPAANAATSVTDSGFTAKWSAASGATGYRLDVSTNNAFSTCVTGWQDVDIGNSTSRSVSGLSAGTTYYYRVRAYNSSGASGNSDVISVATLPPRVTATRQGSQIVLKWPTNAVGFGLQCVTNLSTNTVLGGSLASPGGGSRTTRRHQ